MGGVFRNFLRPKRDRTGDVWQFFYSSWDGIESG
jgi:hypothetical protein